MPITPATQASLRKITQALFYLNALVWLGISLASLLRTRSAVYVGGAAWLLVVGLMAGNAAALLLAGLGLGWKRRIFYYFAVLVLLVNILLTFTDQFGPLDLATLLLDLIILTLLVILHPRLTG